jgi:hypothetical protein
LIGTDAANLRSEVKHDVRAQRCVHPFRILLVRQIKVAPTRNENLAHAATPKDVNHDLAEETGSARDNDTGANE